MEISIDILQVGQVSQSYVDWYMNKEIVRFSDNQYGKFSFEEQRAYVERCLKSDDLDLYGIFDSDFHIGNIQIKGLTSVHNNAELSYVIGETSYWGKGIASFAISEIITLVKKKYKLNRLYAGISEGNYGSQKVLEKNGFILEGCRCQHLLYTGKYYNQLDYGLLLSK